MERFAKTVRFMCCVLGALVIAERAHAEMKPVGENVYNYWSDWYNSLVVVGDKGVLVVDPSSPERAKRMKADIVKLTDKPITHVVLTHEHYDHVGGTEVFEGANIVCHVSCAKIFDLDVMGMAPKKVTQTFKDKLSIDLGNKNVDLTHITAGDGVATTIVYVPADQVVATADLYAPKSFTDGMWLEDKNYLGTRMILKEINGWPLKHALSGHAESTDPSALRENLEYLNDLYSLVRVKIDEAMEKGGLEAAFALMSSDFVERAELPKYQNWDGYGEHFSKHVWRMGMSILHGG